MDRPLEGTRPQFLSPPMAAGVGRVRAWLARAAGGLLARLLGAADGRAVVVVAAREFSLIMRSRAWHQHLGLWLVTTAAVLFVPILYRADVGRWLEPDGRTWFILCGYGLLAACALSMIQWTVRRLRRDLYSDRLDELMLTRCSAADIAMGEALASAFASVWLVAAAFPVCVLLGAIAGLGLPGALRLNLSLLPVGPLGVWFGMGWGLAFTLRRSAAIVPLTEWWVKGPFMPVWLVWAALGCFPVIWAVLGLVPGGIEVLGAVVAVIEGIVRQLVKHWNPLLVIGGAAGAWGTTWITDWVMLLLIMLFMMRKSMDVIQIALTTLPERDASRPHTGDYWIHHDAHYFTQYGEATRLQPHYREGANPIAAFDVALGHRVFMHPFFWYVAGMVHVCLLVWSVALPEFGLYTGIAAVLTPATGALLLMSGGVAISFGWERDQHRWPALAVLPVTNLGLALGKIWGVIRPTLWVGLTAGLTAVLLGCRGALNLEAALWMALHVVLFPVTLAFVSATLALTTPTLGEALYRWAVLGAIPTVATLLPFPIGGHSGIALPFTPPLVVLLLELYGPTADLIRASWISLGLEVFGISLSLWIMHRWLRQWTVGERD